MTWCNDCDDDTNDRAIQRSSLSTTAVVDDRPPQDRRFITCPSCGHRIESLDQAGIQDLPGLPAGVKFDPTDQELLEHLEGKVHTDADGGETRWHKTGKTRPVFAGGKVKGYKKILVLYTNYGKQRKPEKTNWVMHQYHLGNNEEEKDGELVVSKVFYQTQPRQCGSIVKDAIPVPAAKSKALAGHDSSGLKDTGHAHAALVEYYNSSSLIAYEQSGHNRASSPQLIPDFVVHPDGSSFLP
uniref:NAC domain-containing protein n=1 Tax=Nelumbo nucifera TaxID=4432 RepID=A0A822XUK7_NELNU|nr:TPA_asm: hypothetical protein HUJ06_024242 [Nelumbo nucifera]